jgi:hypothetical protein
MMKEGTMKGNGNGGRERYVRCKVARGFFDSERYVILASSSAYVDGHLVRSPVPPISGQVDGEVRAYIVRETKDKALVELPGQPVVGGLRTWVPKAALAAA